MYNFFQNFNQLTKFFVLILFLVCCGVYYFKFDQINNYFYYISFGKAKRAEIKEWFNREALNDTSGGLHIGSAWHNLTEEKFKEVILDGISKMNPPIKKHEKIFEFGMGVGAPFKVIENYIGPDQLELAGSDIAENAISQAKKNFPGQSDNFFVRNMIEKNHNIPDNYYDHVLSSGALAMYLITKDEMKKAIKEAVRITKPGGSILLTAFIAPGGKSVGSIVLPLEQSFFERNSKELGIENIRIYGMKYQGDRYMVTFNKKS